MSLLERESAMASLVRYAHRARAGEGRLVLVSGEAGIGKSSLVEEFTARLPAELPGTRCAWGMCDGLFTPRPLGPLYDIADELGGDLLNLCRARAPRDELFAALLRQVGEPGRLDVVVVEDLHWADEATIDLVRYLGRRLRGTPVLLIVTYRDDGPAAADPLRIALGTLGTQQSTRRIELAPLSARAVGVLAGGSGLAAAELHRLTGGNPFFVTEVVRSGVAAGIPASARDAVLARVAVLSDAARGVLEVAALMGARLDPGLLAAVGGGPPEALDELVTSGLLVGDGAGLRFRHELARLAVERAIPVHRTGGLHARILAGLRAAESDDDTAIAWHAECAGDGAAVLEFAVRAARRSAELASHREAAAQYTRALRFAGGLGPAEQAELYDALTYELSLVDRWEEAADAARRAGELWGAAGDRLREGATLRLLSAALTSLCRGVEAIAAAERAVATLGPLGPSAELAWAYANLAAQFMLANRDVEADDLAGRAYRVADSLALHEVRADALITRGSAARTTNPRWADAGLKQALQIALEHGLEEQAGRAYTNLHGLLCDARRHAEAEPYYAAGVAYCDEHDVATFGTSLRGERANALVRAGRWDEAAEICRRLLTPGGGPTPEDGYARPSPINKITPLANLGILHARRGTGDALRCLDEAVEAADGSAEPQCIMRARLLRAEAHWLAGRLDDARADAERADDVAAGSHPWIRGAVADWLHRTGSSRPARDGIAEPYRLALAGDWAAAARRWLDLDCPYEAALALLDADDDEALRRALRILDELGATATARLARHRLRRRGARSIPAGPRTATRAHPVGLTRREHEVLDLVCAGCTNAEIAGRLVISVKTVDHHVSAILAKLGTPTRATAAAEAVRLGLVDAARP